jgi:biopolymer transport protein ExbD
MDCRLSPPLVPLLDVLFVLLLFLMLVTDFGPREQELLRLPEAVSMKECRKWSSRPPEAISINTHHRDDRACPPHAQGRRCEEEGHWTISLHGNECTDPKILAGVLTRTASSRRNPGCTSVRDARIIIRSDAQAPYGLVQQVMEICSRMGFHRFEFSAARPRR